MRRMIAALLAALAAPAASQTVPPAFYAPTNVAVESSGVAEVRIVRGSPSASPSVFHVTTNDFSIHATAIWPADITSKVDITVTIQPGQLVATAMIPLAYHDSFQDTKQAIVRIEPVSNASIDRTEVPLVIFDGDKSHTDAWKPAATFVKNGFVRLRADSDGYPKIETYFGTWKPDYSNLYPVGVAGEVFRVIDSGYAAVSGRKVWHVVKLNNVTHDLWFYEDDLQPVAAVYPI
jgi:hypothetical protein